MLTDFNEEYDNPEIDDDILKMLNECFDKPLSPEEIERRKKQRAIELQEKGFLPENDELDETMTSPQEEVELAPKRFIIEECIPACKELWAKNIYTFMVSDHLNEGQIWVEVVFDALSDENKEIYNNLTGDDVIKFSYHKGCVNFGVNCVGELGQQKLLELAKQFKMQDVPKNLAWITEEEFLMGYCGCYDEYDNPNYIEMLPPGEVSMSDDQIYEYIKKYDEWQYSTDSQKKLRKFSSDKVTKSTFEYSKEHGMIFDQGKIYLGQFHFQKHQEFLKHLQKYREDGESQRN